MQLNNNLSKEITSATVLTKILADKKIWLEKHKQKFPLQNFVNKLTKSQSNLCSTLTKGKNNFILECKKASPSKGLIRKNFDLVNIAKIYNQYANVISVLTDEKYFQGSFENLKIVSDIATKPVLCKDFIIDEYQIYLARYYGANAILLMLSVIDDNTYKHLSNIATSLNMGILTEASNELEVNRAISLNAKVIGINNRNLKDLSVDISRVKNLIANIPEQTFIISESGINTRADIDYLQNSVDGFLIGSSLMAQENLELAIKTLLFGHNKICGLTNNKDAIAVANKIFAYAGLIFADSPRQVNLSTAQGIRHGVNLNWVAVFKNHNITLVADIADKLNIDIIQLHGNEDENYINKLTSIIPKHCKIWKAMSISHTIPNYNSKGYIDKYLFDGISAGSGVPFNWELLQNKNLSNVILAGGISSDNIKQALTFNASGLDLNSGVELSAGIKDLNKLATVSNIIKEYKINKKL